MSIEFFSFPPPFLFPNYMDAFLFSLGYILNTFFAKLHKGKTGQDETQQQSFSYK